MTPTRRRPSRTAALRAVVAVAVVALLAPAALSFAQSAVAGSDETAPDPEDGLHAGKIEAPANGTTVISVQGFRFEGMDSGKKPARLVGVGPRGEVEWVHQGKKRGIVWFYDVDPLPDGNVLVTGTKRGETVVYSLDPDTGDIAWSQSFDIEDTHDVDLVNGDQLLVASMRNYNETAERNNDRLFLYDLSEDEIVWEWYFRNHYPEDSGGTYTDDWTHVNDVDKIGDGRYLVSPRNLDQVIVVDRSTKEIEGRLGSDDDHGVLREQHNPDYLESENGTPTLLVADSGNDRIVEYALRDGSWERTWLLGEEVGLSWPRDADRLPGGNTLVTDTMHHRVLEVTPTGEVVWEFYAPWAPYDAERIARGGGSTGPTMADLGASGSYAVSKSAGRTFGDALLELFEGTPIEREGTWFARRWAHITPWIRPVWMTSWEFAAAVAGGLLLLGWGVGETVYRRGAFRRRLERRFTADRPPERESGD